MHSDKKFNQGICANASLAPKKLKLRSLSGDNQP